MSDLVKYREILGLLKIQQTAREGDLAAVMKQKRELLARAQSFRQQAFRTGEAQENPTGGDLMASALAGAALRGRAGECDRAIKELASEIERREQALTQIIAKVTAVNSIIASLELQESRMEEERQDEATLDATQLKE